MQKYKKKKDFIEAYRVSDKAPRETLQMNQSGYYEPAYHGMITTTLISWVDAGDYIIKHPNDIYTAMKKEEFEQMYECIDEVPVIEKVSSLFKKDEPAHEKVEELVPDSEKEEPKKKRKAYRE